MLHWFKPARDQHAKDSTLMSLRFYFGLLSPPLFLYSSIIQGHRNSSLMQWPITFSYFSRSFNIQCYQNMKPDELNDCNITALTWDMCNPYFPNWYRMNTHHFKLHKSHMHDFIKTVSHSTSMRWTLWKTVKKKLTVPRILNGPGLQLPADRMALMLHDIAEKGEKY